MERLDRAAELEMSRLREEIDLIDRELIALFEKRMDAARELGRIKRAHNMDIKNGRRELEVIANCRDNCKNGMYRPYAESLMECIMGAARGLQQSDAPDADGNANIPNLT